MPAIALIRRGSELTSRTGYAALTPIGVSATIRPAFVGCMTRAISRKAARLARRELAYGLQREEGRLQP